jgi:hypothetical protein
VIPENLAATAITFLVDAGRVIEHSAYWRIVATAGGLCRSPSMCYLPQLASKEV